MRRVVATFGRAEGGKRAAEKEMVEQAERLTKMGLGRVFGVYVDRTLPKSNPNRRFAPWAVWIVDK